MTPSNKLEPTGFTGAARIPGEGVLYHTPDNLNPQPATNYKLLIPKCPAVEFFCQTVTLPGVAITPMEQATQFNPVRYPAGAYDEDNLEISFVVSEDLENWKQLREWMLMANTYTDFKDVKELEKVFSDEATLLINSSKNRPTTRIHFNHLFPISLGSLEFTSTDTDGDAIISTATFAYSYYKISNA